MPLVEELRRRAADQRVAGKRCACCLHEPLRRAVEERLARRGPHLPDAAAPSSSRRQHERARRTARAYRAASASPSRGRPRRRATANVGGKSCRSAVSTTRELTLGGSTDASTPVKRIDEERQRRARRAAPSRRSRPATAAASARARAGTSRPARRAAARSAARRQRAQRERVHALRRAGRRAPAAPSARSARERPDEAAGDPHRPQEAEREDRERRDRGADRDRAERDRPAGRGDRRAHRVRRRARGVRAPRGSGRRAAGCSRSPSPRPAPVTMFSAYVETGSARSRRRRRSSPPRIVSAPQRSGSSAATTLRKTQSASRNRIGKAIFSASVRSCWIWWFTCTVASAVPPTATPATAASRVVDARRGLAPVALRRRRRVRSAATSASRPSRERSGGGRTGTPAPSGSPHDPREPPRGRVAHEDEQLRRGRQARRALDRRSRAQALAALGDEVVRAAPEQPRRLRGRTPTPTIANASAAAGTRRGAPNSEFAEHSEHHASVRITGSSLISRPASVRGASVRLRTASSNYEHRGATDAAVR